MTAAPDTAVWTALADRFRPKQRRWATPGAMARELDPTTVQTPALDLIDSALVDVADGRCDRLMVLMAPQEGKSERVSRGFPRWMLQQNPDLRIGDASYSDEMARRWGHAIRDDFESHCGDEDTLDLGVRLRADSRAAGRWQIVGHRGGMYCAGIGGSWTGKPLDGLVVDDPLKDLEQANSAVYRDRFRRFWQGVVIPRLAPGAWVVLIQTRWHEDDPAGWLQRQEPGRWRVISIPAVAEAADDPLGRQPGEPMVSARGERDWAQIRRDVGEYVWAALYQQRPAPVEGGLFKRDNWRYWTPMFQQRIELGGRTVDLRDCWRFATVDLAASTKTSADWTVASAWAVTAASDALILLDRRRARLGERQHIDLLRPLTQRWAVDVAFVEKSFTSSTLAVDATRAGVLVSPVDAESDKLTRAIPYSARVDAGSVWLPAGASWLSEWIDEHAGFPNATHDDQVDTGSYAVRVLGARWNPVGNELGRGEAQASPADPWGASQTDFMSVPM